MWISGEPFVFTDWSTDQPDNGMGGGAEMCVSIRPYSFHTIGGLALEYVKWNDLTCTSNTATVIIGLLTLNTIMRPICKQEQTV